MKTEGNLQTPPVNEPLIWGRLGTGWRQLYGGFYGAGISLEEHEFGIDEPFEWSRSFHGESLELCLNLAGRGTVRCGKAEMLLSPLTAGFYVSNGTELRAWRKPGKHQFVTIEFSANFLKTHLSQYDGSLHPIVEQFLSGRSDCSGLGPVHSLTAEQESCVKELLHPRTPLNARNLWYEGKVLQLMADFLFERRGADELFCDRQKRVARDRVEKAMALLRRDLTQPPDLEELGRKVGCSQFHLSRTFSAQTGLTIPQYLRKIRMERAAELLRSGKYNVTEAALEVGYSSLSHFSQAFCQVIGCCPGLYPTKKGAPVDSKLPTKNSK